MKTNQSTFEIGWAYPTSTHAVKFGFRWEGCYVVQRIDYDKGGCRKPPVGLSGHATESEAQMAMTIFQRPASAATATRIHPITRHGDNVFDEHPVTAIRERARKHRNK